MSDWRQSFVFARELEYGGGQDVTDMFGYWYEPPPGAKFSSTYTREGTKLRPVSARTWTEMNYGKVSGSWSMQFPLDYDYMEIFMFVYDSYTFVPVADGNDHATYGRHIFKRTDGGVTPSFCVRRKTMYRPVGADEDLIDEIYGCLVTACKVSIQSGTSQAMVHLSGVFADQKLGISAGLVTGILNGTDYRKRIPNPVQYSCLYIGDEPISDVLALSVQMKNTVVLKHGILLAVARTYTEEESSNTFSCTVFAKDSKTFRQRVFTGGYQYGNSSYNEMSLPLPELTMRSSASTEDEQIHRNLSNIQFKVTDVVVRSMGWDADSTVLVDKLDSVDCTSISIVVENLVPYRYDLSQNVRGELNIKVEDLTHPEEYVMIYQDPSTDRIVCNAPGHLMLSETYVS